MIINILKNDAQFCCSIPLIICTAFPLQLSSNGLRQKILCLYSLVFGLGTGGTRADFQTPDRAGTVPVFSLRPARTQRWFSVSARIRDSRRLSDSARAGTCAGSRIPPKSGPRWFSAPIRAGSQIPYKPGPPAGFQIRPDLHPGTGSRTPRRSDPLIFRPRPSRDIAPAPRLPAGRNPRW